MVMDTWWINDGRWQQVYPGILLWGTITTRVKPSVPFVKWLSLKHTWQHEGRRSQLQWTCRLIAGVWQNVKTLVCESHTQHSHSRKVTSMKANNEWLFMLAKKRLFQFFLLFHVWHFCLFKCFKPSDPRSASLFALLMLKKFCFLQKSDFGVGSYSTRSTHSC